MTNPQNLDYALQAAKDKFEAAMLAKQRQEAKERAMAEEAANSLAILKVTVQDLVNRALLADPYEAGKVFSLHIELSADPLRAYVGICYDLLNSPVYGLTRDRGVLYWGYKSYRGLDKLRQDIEGLVTSSPMLSPVYFASLVGSIASPPEDLSEAQLRTIAIDRAIKVSDEPSIPSGLTLTDQIRLATAMGMEAF